MTKQHKADVALVFVTMSWGISFILTKLLIEDIGVFNFLSQRFLLAALIAAIFFKKQFREITPRIFFTGMLIGFMLFGGYALQTIGLLYTSISNSAFITGFAVVLVPILSIAFFKSKPSVSAVLGALMALAGLALLTLRNTYGFSEINFGDFLTFLSAICFAMHIISVGIFAKKGNAILLAITQIFGVGFFSMIAALSFEKHAFPSTASNWGAMLFLAVICTSLAFIAQNKAQKYTTASHTALIYSGEPVFATICEFFVYGTMLSGQGLFGAFLILSGIIISELNPFRKRRSGHVSA
ncbi:MAG: DMT family transporter [Peptostreptococcaceae bacterium]|nr:DMT family transporter [Peptostreptococcaceae bacterium]